MAMHLYRTQRTPIETLLACHVGRSHVVEGVLADLRSRGPGASRQHFMFIGPRGIGKTTLLRLVAHGIESDPELKARYLPIVFPEEGYSLTRVSDLMVRLAQTMAQEHGIEEFRAVYDQVRHDDHDRRVVDTAAEAMRRHHARTGQGAVVMFENTNRFLERQKRNKDELHLLRALMISEPWLTGVFTSPTYLNALTDEREPFFEFFKVQTLGELSQDELLDMLRRLTEHEDNAVFRAYLDKHSSRVRALYHFTGGNPRLALMLYELVSRHDIAGVREELDALLDQITPFYQDRMKDLSEQEARVIEAMSLIPEGCPPKTLATETRLGQGVTRMVLKRLENAGYVRREKHSDGKTVYIIPERLFRIWNSMNNSRAAKGKVQYLVEFFAMWYATEEERAEVWMRLIELVLSSAPADDNTKEYLEYVYEITSHEERIRHIVNSVLNVGIRPDEVAEKFRTMIGVFRGKFFEGGALISTYIAATLPKSDLRVLTEYLHIHRSSTFASFVMGVVAPKSQGFDDLIMLSVEDCVESIVSGDKYCYENAALILAFIRQVAVVKKIPEMRVFSNLFWVVAFETMSAEGLQSLVSALLRLIPNVLEKDDEPVIASGYITSRSPAVLEKHPPEVREAALKLVEAFDSNPANKAGGDTPKS